ncbi:ABC transporter substrate-binding protein [Tessaracoccus coleopterorum]|uniref:ABC transporter substrate-binding protein n=1 Tax=Tessaracoccus coleopterorum TaxID=2714950 RepID=UPI001E552D3B|nr:ABC transporter substrate-binding protein [Tessaracoccus coleopterorum]
MMVAIGACSAIDVDLVTTRKVEPGSFDVDVHADRVKDADGNRADNIEVDFMVRLPEGPEGTRPEPCSSAPSLRRTTASAPSRAPSSSAPRSRCDRSAEVHRGSRRPDRSGMKLPAPGCHRAQRPASPCPHDPRQGTKHAPAQPRHARHRLSRRSRTAAHRLRWLQLPTSSGSPSADAEIEIGSLYEPGNLSNVDAGGQGITEAFNGNVYESLMKLGDDGSVSPLLAEGYAVSDDGLTYTFTLRDGVTFHSGRALTSADVKASFERVVAESSQAARKSSYQVVSDVATPDDKTVVFTLSQRSISFPYLMAYVWIVNPELADPLAQADGTGPYTFDEWKRGSTLSIVRNDAYWGEKAKNGRVTFHYFTDASAESNALLSNEIDLVTSIQSPTR